jgi:hypothetical protein
MFNLKVRRIIELSSDFEHFVPVAMSADLTGNLLIGGCDEQFSLEETYGFSRFKVV